MPRTFGLACIIFLLLSGLLSGGLAAQNKNTSPRKPSRARNNNKGSQSDKEYGRRRASCSVNNEVLQPCIDQEIDTENCIMKCISESCYRKSFPEPMEEGEVLFERTNKFKRCAKEDIKTAYRKGDIL